MHSPYEKKCPTHPGNLNGMFSRRHKTVPEWIEFGPELPPKPTTGKVRAVPGD